MLPPWLEPYSLQFAGLIRQQQLAHGLMLKGPQGIGKQLLADWLAASLLCTESVPACGQCKSCLLRQAGNHPDLFITDSSGSSIGVDAVRQISQFMQGRAQQQLHKVVILPDADKLTEAASNALLKTLEEPPANSYIILYSANVQTLPATLLSRCQQWTLAAQFGADVLGWLSTQCSNAVPEFVLSYAAGGPLKALAMLESGEAQRVEAALQALTQFFIGQLSVTDCTKLLEPLSDTTQALGWYIRRQLLPQLAVANALNSLAIQQAYGRWCRDEKEILGQNKQLALNAFLTELKRLQG